jgi:glutathione S-transferase
VAVLGCSNYTPRSSGHRPATDSYVIRVTDRPSFKKARADQLAHFAAADENRSAVSQ